MHRECRERFPRHRRQRKPLVSNPGIHHSTCVTHVPWCMSGSLTCGGGEDVSGIYGACTTRNYTYLARGPLSEITRFCRVLIVQIGKYVLFTPILMVNCLLSLEIWNQEPMCGELSEYVYNQSDVQSTKYFRSHLHIHFYYKFQQVATISLLSVILSLLNHLITMQCSDLCKPESMVTSLIWLHVYVYSF